MQVKGRVLSVASECVPFVKTGGLADVVGALPAALAPFGWQMRVLLPGYRALRQRTAKWVEVWHESNLWGGEGRVVSGTLDGIDLMILDAPHLYDREGGPYGAHSGPGGDWWDNPQRFAALSWVAAKIASQGAGDGWKPDVLHGHDWHAGFAPAYLAYGGKGGVGSVMTIHNIAFQGWAAAAQLDDLRLPPEQFYPGALEYYGNLSSLKAGLVTCDRITAVSPTYAADLVRAEAGLGLDGVIRARSSIVSGILNGVDTDIWSPELEPIAYKSTDLRGKAVNRANLCAEFNLDVPGPLAIVVSRMTDQKGIDLLPHVIPEFIANGGGVIVLGSGDGALEQQMHDLAWKFPGRVGLRVGYDEAMSHRMFAGGDAVLVPSRFEPCGLTQLYGLRYGTIPVVSAVGGLADTVITANPAALAAGVATGITFHPTDVPAFRIALRHLTDLYWDKPKWAKLQQCAMAQDVSWSASAAKYAALYESLRG